jgi:hypothetical protein
MGRPSDFRNTLRHINTRGQFPAIQRLMNAFARVAFSVDVAPVRHPAPAGDAWATASCSVAACTALLTRSGGLYMLGHNYHGQAGCGRGYGDFPLATTPVAIGALSTAEERVVGVSVGFEHVLAVTQLGTLYAWGRGDRGQLGVGDKDSYMSPVRVLGPDDAFLGDGDGGSSSSAGEGGRGNNVGEPEPE